MKLKNLQKYLTEYTYIYKYTKGQNELFVEDDFCNQVSIYEKGSGELLFTFFVNGIANRVFTKGSEKIFKTLREMFSKKEGIEKIYEKINNI